MMKRASAIVASCAFLLSSFCAFAQETRLVIKGFDPVAFFTEGKPVKGDPNLAYDWDEGRYHFASSKNRDMFAQNPEKFAPQFGGFCTGSMSRNVLNDADPESFVIRDGKLYFFGDKKWKPVAEGDPAYLPSKLPGAAKNYEERKRRS
jgi:YHS domain-containing protein